MFGLDLMREARIFHGSVTKRSEIHVLVHAAKQIAEFWEQLWRNYTIPFASNAFSTKANA